MMTRLPLLALLLCSGCLSSFSAGPAIDAALPRAVTVKLAGCTTPKRLFECRYAPAVVTYLGDFFRLNGLRPARKGRPSAAATVQIAEDRNVVAVTVTLRGPAGLIWRAEGQGDTLLRALIRLEKSLEGGASFRARLLRHKDLRDIMGKLGRKRISAGKTSFFFQ